MPQVTLHNQFFSSHPKVIDSQTLTRPKAGGGASNGALSSWVKSPPAKRLEASEVVALETMNSAGSFGAVALGASAAAVPMFAITTAKAAASSRHLFKTAYPAAFGDVIAQQIRIIKQCYSEQHRIALTAPLAILHNQSRALFVQLDKKNIARNDPHGLLRAALPLKGSNVAGLKPHKVASTFAEAAHVLVAEAGSDQLRYEVARYDRLLATMQATHRQRNFSAPAALGLGGITTGLATATAARASAVGGAHAAAAALGAATSALFLGPTLLLGAAATADTVANARSTRRRGADLKAIDSLEPHLDAEVLDSVKATLRKQARYDVRKAVGSSMTTAGLGMLASGGILSLVPQTVPAGLPVTLAGLNTLVVGKVINPRATARAAKFNGAGASPLARQRAAQFDARPNVMARGVPDAVRTAGALFATHQESLVLAKLMSLIGHVLERERKHKPAVEPSAEERRAHVARLARTSTKSLFKGTTLLKAERAMLSRLFDEQFPIEYFQGTVSDIEGRMLIELRDNSFVSDMAASAPILQRVLHDTVHALRKSKDVEVAEFLRRRSFEPRRTITGDDLRNFAGHNAAANAELLHQRLAITTKQAKRDAKLMRSLATVTLSDLAHSVAASPPAKPSEPVRVASPDENFGSYSVANSSSRVTA